MASLTQRAPQVNTHGDHVIAVCACEGQNVNGFLHLATASLAAQHDVDPDRATRHARPGTRGPRTRHAPTWRGDGSLSRPTQ
jgi:hypothetical protein